MLALALHTALAATPWLDPWEVVRVEDPDHPDAIAVSSTGALIEGPPADIPWRYESMAETDDWPATEALSAMNLETWHDDGHMGQGSSVAVLDVGWFGADLEGDLAAATTHDCWASPTCELSFSTYTPRFEPEGGVHGVACAEIVADIAPLADLHLVRVNSFTTFENAVDWAIRNEIDVLSMSLSFYNNSYYDGTGPFADLVDRLAANDVLLVTSAGNDARGHWSGAFRDQDNDGRMDFEGNNGLWTYLREGTRQFYVNWNQYGLCGTSDLDVQLVNEEGAIIDRSTRSQLPDADSCSPNERIRAEIVEEGWYRLEVLHERGSTAFLDVRVHARNSDLDEADPHGSVVDPATHPRAFAVGAVRADGYVNNNVESFSSWGPTDGGVAKPDIAGPNGLSTDAFGARGFYGTSAATPAVAALIAVVLSEDPELTPAEAATRIQRWALADDTLFDQPDPRWGAGKARLPVFSGERAPCGHRPLIMPLVLLPLSWWRRRRLR